MDEPYQTILFDLDDTLIDFKKSQALSLERCHASFFKNRVDFEQFNKDYALINCALWKLAEAGKISPSLIGKERFKQLSDHLGISNNSEIAAYYEEQLIENSTWIPSAPDLLDALKEKNIKIGFVTNGFSHIQKSKYRKLNLEGVCKVRSNDLCD